MDLAQDSSAAVQKAKAALCHLLASALGLQNQSSQGNLSGLGKQWGGREILVAVYAAFTQSLLHLRY